MAVTFTGFGPLPNEILMNILSLFPTRDLLNITLTSQRIHDVILCILHTRLIQAASLKNHKLILECFHPSAKLSTPYLFCEYLGTDGLSDTVEGEGSLYHDIENTGGLGKLSGLYSHFRPLHPEEDRRVIRPHPAGGWAPGPVNNMAEKQGEFVGQNIHLESHELFSQLCTITSLVKVGPKRGLFVSCVNISDGLTRIFRDWLAERAGDGKPPSKAVQDAAHENQMLWADSEKHVGLRLRVQEREDVPEPVLLRAGEDAPVSYALQYEELVIRTTQLLLMVEQSIDLEVNHSGKAVVIGSWDQ